MPPIFREIEQAAIGCWMLARGREAGLERFNLSMDGFWHSFRWAYVLAVLDALDALIGRESEPDGYGVGPSVALFVISAIASLITFFGFPLIVALLSKPMGLAARYSSYIIARNWLLVFLSLPIYVIDALSTLDILPDDLRNVLIIVVVIATLAAATGLARTTLATSRSLAFGFALLDFLLTLLINEAASRLIS